MLHLIYFLLACWGITQIITLSSIFAPVRRVVTAKIHHKIGELISCPQCTGFWVGLGLAFAFPAPEVICWRPLEVFAQGAISSGVCTILAALLGWFGWEAE